MNLSGSRLISADRATVWSALNDADVLKACINGCQELEKTSETSFEATVNQKSGNSPAGSCRSAQLRP